MPKQRYYDGETGEFSMLPSPMQLFSTSSAVTTVHVEHPPPSDRDPGNWEPLDPSNWEGQGQQIGIPEEVRNGERSSSITWPSMYKSYSFATFVRLFFQPSLMRPQTATFTKTTSAKRISTSSFKVKEGERLSTGPN